MYPLFQRVIKPPNIIMMPALIAPPSTVNAEPKSIQNHKSRQLYQLIHPGIWRMMMAQPSRAASLIIEPAPS
jgi:hypothetical protein